MQQNRRGDEEDESSSSAPSNNYNNSNQRSVQRKGEGGGGAKLNPPPPNVLQQLPALVPDDEDERSAEAALRQFREQWKQELQSTNSTNARVTTPKGNQGPEAVLMKRGGLEAHTLTHARDEQQLQYEQEGEEAMAPIPFSTPEDEELVIAPQAPSTSLHIGQLPNEVLIYLFCFADGTTLGRISFVCKKAYALTREPVLWRNLCVRLWKGNCFKAIHKQFGTWHQMYLTRPRVRFDGIFISKNTYLRPGVTEWAYNQPVHRVVYYRYLRFYSDSSVLYAMSLEEPRKALRWLNTKHLPPSQTSSRDKAQLQTASHPSPGTYHLDDVSGSMDIWVSKEGNTQHFSSLLTCRKAARSIAVSVNEYTSTSRSGLLTTYDNVPIAKFFFYKVPAHMLDPVIVEVEPGRRDTATAQQQTA